MWWTIFFVTCSKISGCERNDQKNKNYCHDWAGKQFTRKDQGTDKGWNGCCKVELFPWET